jgi:cytochrome c peroxidase
MIKTKLIFGLFIFIILLSNSCLNIKHTSTSVSILNAYRQGLKQLSEETQQFIHLVEIKSGATLLQQQFIKARLAYKKVEWLAEYYYPYTAKKINGPALQEVEADEKSIIIQPEGFQVIEEMLFHTTRGNLQSPLLQQSKILQSNISRLNYMASIQETTDANIFDALRLEIFRIIALGITGFDSPIANNSIAEAAASIEGIAYCLSFYRETINNHNRHLYDSLQALFKDATKYLSKANNVNSFDRMRFIKSYLNPISENIILVQYELNIPFFKEPRALKAEAGTLFAKNIFNTDYYTPNIQSYSTPEKITLGKKLFYDGILSGDGTRSCATCHQPGKAFSDGLATSKGMSGGNIISRNTPTLINAALQPSLFFDMRVNYLEDQAKDVISNKNEMHGSFENALKYINGNKDYQELFKQVYKDEKPSDLHIRNSIGAYVRSLTALNSRFDQYIRGNNNAMNQTEIDGFNLFTGKAKCATCHFLPLFNGANPPVFNKMDAEVIGVPASSDSMHPILDGDKGKYNVYKVALHKNSFKTPTIRNIELTAPYMHNGVFKTLEEVVEFYNRGGGKGLGLKVENQTLPADKLHLNAIEKKSLVAFMKSVTDTVVNVYK